MHTLHALIIDDQTTGLDVMRELLSALGVEATTIQEPARVRQVVASLARVDVVFLDLEMPQIDGYDMLQILRELLGSVPVIAYTVHVQEMETARGLGFDGFLAKPLDIDRFAGQFQRIMDGEAVWDAS